VRHTSWETVSRKVSILQEELGLPYKARPIDTKQRIAAMVLSLRRRPRCGSASLLTALSLTSRCSNERVWGSYFLPRSVRRIGWEGILLSADKVCCKVVRFSTDRFLLKATRQVRGSAGSAFPICRRPRQRFANCTASSATQCGSNPVSSQFLFGFSRGGFTAHFLLCTGLMSVSGSFAARYLRHLPNGRSRGAKRIVPGNLAGLPTVA
jgi:hypothetical protein